MMRARRREVALEQRPRPLRMALGETEEGEVPTGQGRLRVGHDGAEPGDAPARPHQRRRRRVLPALDLGDAERDEMRVEEGATRSEEHTSELQSPCNLVCRLLLE